jgi:hypothetical protein
MKKILAITETDLLAFLSALIISGTFVYYIWALNWWGWLATLILTILISWAYKFFNKTAKEKSEAAKPELSVAKSTKKIFPLLIGLYFSLSLVGVWYLYRAMSDQALISPWQTVSPLFFTAYLGATVVLIYLFWTGTVKRTTGLWLLRWHLLLTLSIAAIVYKIGYGFDPFIHQATAEMIDKNGFVLPKTPYYIGQYTLVIFLHKISGLSIYWLNKFLVPLTAAIFLPGALSAWLLKNQPSKKMALGLLLILIWPLSLFTISTPQNLSYVFLILTIFYTWLYPRSGLSWLLAGATAAIHPLSGLPAIFLAAFPYAATLSKKSSTRLILKIILGLGLAVSLPIALALATKETVTALSFSVQALPGLFAWPAVNTNQTSIIFNFIYFWADWLPLVIIGLAVAGWRQLKKSHPEETSWLLSLMAAIFLALLISSSLKFSLLISYERENYINRLPILILLFALPFILQAGASLIEKIITRRTSFQIISALILLLLIGANLYLSYPRQDAYFNSHGYSVSAADLQAVTTINQRANGRPYLVLANQQTSVGALVELGFNHYYQTASGPLFFYPIPTGGALYQYYLDMVYKTPSRETMEQAMSLLGVNRAYLAVSRYWYASPKTVAEAKLTANNYWSINNGEISIFEFKR